MLTRIDLFMPSKGSYGVLHHFTLQLGKALERAGIKVRFLEAEYNNPKPFLDKIFSDPPNCTLSFNGLLPDAEGNFFCELIKIPHIACLVDSPIHFYPLAQSNYNIIGCVDKYDVDFFKNIHFNNSFFFPHAGDPESKKNGHHPRIYDVVMMASLIDYITIRDNWREKFPPLVCQAMEDATELVLSDNKTTCISAFVEVIDSYVKGPVLFDPSSVDFLTCLAEIEAYAKGRDRVEMVRAITDAKVYVFGSAPKGSSWNKFVGDKPNVVVHEGIPFDQTLEIMRQCKLVLSSASRIKYGADGRVFYSLGCGALPITESNPYLNEVYKDRESICYFEAGKWDQINEIAHYYIENETERYNAAELGSELMMEHDTWNNRAELLIEKVKPILEQLSVAK